MQAYEFEKQIAITYPECDIHNLLKLSNIMRRIQEVSGEHLDALGLPYQLLWEKGFVYLLTKVGLNITRRPHALEHITLLTKPRTPKGVQSLRDIYFMDEQGNPIIHAQTAWVLVDPEEHRIRRPTELPHIIEVEPQAVEHELVKAKLKRPPELRRVGRRTVHYSDLDSNMHMNNAVYSDIVCDFLPLQLHKEHEITQFVINFLGEVALEDEITVYAGQTGPGTYHIAADRPAGDACFEASLRYR